MGEGKTVAIIGAGPAGLTTALLLAQRGWIVHVFEKRDHPEKDAITNGQRSIVNLVLERGQLALKKAGFDLPDASKGEVWKNNTAICSGLRVHKNPKKPTKDALPPAKNVITGINILLTERDALNIALTADVARRFPKEVTIMYKHTVTNIDFNARKLSFTLESGKHGSLQYDLLVGADGKNSYVRKMLANQQPRMKFESRLIGKSWKSFTGLPQLERLKIQDDEGVGFHNFAAGVVRIVVWPTCHGTFGGYLTQATALFTEENNTIEAYKHLIRKVSSLYPEEWLDLTAQQLVESNMGHVGTAWSSTSCGPSTVLLGDSANAVTPLLGQGLNSALESSSIFVEELDKSGDVDAACQAFDQIRQPELHALQLLDQEGLERIGAKGPLNLKFISALIMQKLVWALLHKYLPSQVDEPESLAINKLASYKKVLYGFKRDEAVVKFSLSILLGMLIYQIISKLIYLVK